MLTRHHYHQSASFCVQCGLNLVNFPPVFNAQQRSGGADLFNKNSSVHRENLTQTFANVIFPVTNFTGAICVTTNNPWVWMIDKL